MDHARTGSLIAAGFGLVYVVVNSGPLPSAWELVLRTLAVLAFAAVAALALRHRHPAAEPVSDRPLDRKDLAARREKPGRSTGRGFGRAFWIVVAVEAVALLVGVRIVAGPLGHPEAAVAWVSLVVGLHFVALAVVLVASFFHLLGGLVTTCGVVGLLLAALDAGTAPIAVVAGVVPGALLLGFGWWGATYNLSR